MAAEGVGNGVVGADCEAVEADNASAHVGDVVVEVYALGFAGVGAASALGAEVGVDVDVEGAVAPDEPEGGGDGAEGVAEEASASVGEDCDCGDYGCCDCCGEPCASEGQRVDQRGVEAIGFEPCAGKRRIESQGKQEDEKRCGGQQPAGALVAEGFAFGAHSCSQVNEGSEGADGRAVDAAEYEGDAEP